MQKIDNRDEAKQPMLSVLAKRRGRQGMESDGGREREQIGRDCENLPLEGRSGAGKERCFGSERKRGRKKLLPKEAAKRTQGEASRNRGMVNYRLFLPGRP